MITVGLISDAGPTLSQHCVNVPYFLGMSCMLIDNISKIMCFIGQCANLTPSWTQVGTQILYLYITLQYALMCYRATGQRRIPYYL